MIPSRIGLFMKKLGCTRVYNGEVAVPVTLLQMCDTHIVGIKTVESDGYSAVILGYGDFKSVAKPQMGVLAKAGVHVRHKLFESRVRDVSGYKVGEKISLHHFVERQYVDITGNTIGKGFAGVMKRHGFAGMCASHGVSLSHRVLGSAGQCQDPGKVNKGKEMAGRMGSARRVIFNLPIIAIDQDLQIMAVKGNSVPGNKGNWVFVIDSARKVLPSEAPVPYGSARIFNGGAE